MAEERNISTNPNSPDALKRDIEAMRGTETIVAAPDATSSSNHVLLEFLSRMSLVQTIDGHAQAKKVRVIIPTENAAKKKILMTAFERRKPDYVVELEFHTLSADSGVGEQPYNLEAGMQGAYNRIFNAYNQLAAKPVYYDSPDKDVAYIFASIENFIQVDGVERLLGQVVQAVVVGAGGAEESSSLGLGSQTATATTATTAAASSAASTSQATTTTTVG